MSNSYLDSPLVTGWERHLERCPVQEGAMKSPAVPRVNVISNLSSTVTTVRIVHEHMEVNGYQPHNLPFSAELLKNIGSSNSRYLLHQDEKKTAKQLNSRELKRKIVGDELAEVRKKKDFL